MNTVAKQFIEKRILTKVYIKLGLVFGFLATIMLPAAPLLEPLFCEIVKGSSGTCQADTSQSLITTVLSILTVVFSLIAGYLISIGFFVTRIDSNKSKKQKLKLVATKTQPLYERRVSAKALRGLGFFFGLLSVGSFLGIPLLQALVCSTTQGTSGICSSFSSIYIMITLIPTFGIISLCLIVVALILKKTATK